MRESLPARGKAKGHAFGGLFLPLARPRRSLVGWLCHRDQSARLAPGLSLVFVVSFVSGRLQHAGTTKQTVQGPLRRPTAVSSQGTMKVITYETAVPELLRVIPEFKGQYDGLLAFLEDATGPHLVFAEFARFVMNQLRTRKKEPVLRRSFEFLEDVAKSEEKEAQELVQMSFLENLGKERWAVERARRFMGPTTLTLLNEIEAFWAGEAIPPR